MNTQFINNINPIDYSHSVSNYQYARQSDIDLYHAIIQRRDTYPYVYAALQCTIDCIARYTIDHIAFSFNGGKDCTVVLHLIRAACAHLNISISRMLTIYFHVANEFHEIEQFMYICQSLYKLDFHEVSGNFKSALHDIFVSRDTKQQPLITAIFMGQRHNDPYCSNLHIISGSDNTWPAFDRLNVCINWSYQQVWSFLVEFQLIYCKLYDDGYTSIGNQLDSIPNPALKLSDSIYQPAYKLSDESLERKGRIERIRDDKTETNGTVSQVVT